MVLNTSFNEKAGGSTPEQVLTVCEPKWTFWFWVT
jgi:hypothetical protein